MRASYRSLPVYLSCSTNAAGFWDRHSVRHASHGAG